MTILDVRQGIDVCFQHSVGAATASSRQRKKAVPVPKVHMQKRPRFVSMREVSSVLYNMQDAACMYAWLPNHLATHVPMLVGVVVQQLEGFVRRFAPEGAAKDGAAVFADEPCISPQVEDLRVFEGAEAPPLQLLVRCPQEPADNRWITDGRVRASP